MFSSFNVFVSFGETKIYDVDRFHFISFTNHEVISFDVPVDKAFAVNLL